MTTEDDIRGALRFFKDTLEGSLLFSGSLVRGLAGHWLQGAEKMSIDYETALVTSSAERNQRKQLLGMLLLLLLIDLTFYRQLYGLI